MEIRLLITVGFSQGIFLIDASRVKPFGQYVLYIQGHSQDNPSLSCIDLVIVTLDLGIL